MSSKAAGNDTLRAVPRKRKQATNSSEPGQDKQEPASKKRRNANSGKVAAKGKSNDSSSWPEYFQEVSLICALFNKAN